MTYNYTNNLQIVYIYTSFTVAYDTKVIMQLSIETVIFDIYA